MSCLPCQPLDDYLAATPSTQNHSGESAIDIPNMQAPNPAHLTMATAQQPLESANQQLSARRCFFFYRQQLRLEGLLWYLVDFNKQIHHASHNPPVILRPYLYWGYVSFANAQTSVDVNTTASFWSCRRSGLLAWLPTTRQKTIIICWCSTMRRLPLQ